MPAPRYGLPSRRTLGAVQPGTTTYSSVGGTPYWLPCMTRATYEHQVDGETEGPHAHFIKTPYDLTFYCPTCFPARRTVPSDADLDARATAAATEPVGPPWGAAEPIWKNKPPMQEWYEERAAILQYEAGMSRARAEHEAYRLLTEREGHRERRRHASLGR